MYLRSKSRTEWDLNLIVGFERVLVVIRDLVGQSITQLINAVELIQVKEFGLKNGKRVLYGRVVAAVTVPSHNLSKVSPVKLAVISLQAMG